MAREVKLLKVVHLYTYLIYCVKNPRTVMRAGARSICIGIEICSMHIAICAICAFQYVQSSNEHFPLVMSSHVIVSIISVHASACAGCAPTRGHRYTVTTLTKGRGNRQHTVPIHRMQLCNCGPQFPWIGLSGPPNPSTRTAVPNGCR